MNHKPLNPNQKDVVTDLFTSVFTSSEGEEEGRLVGKLAAELALGIDNQEIIAFGAFDGDSIRGAIFFSRLRFSDPVEVYLLAPVAVSTDFQGQGIGQALIKHGLSALKDRAVSVVITYGDPAFYAKAGFKRLSETVIQAPFGLSMTEGWLGKSLSESPIPAINGRPTCVKAFNDPVYW